MVKNIEDLDFYDLLSLSPDATQEEIEGAYLLALATYHEDALASHGLLSAEERRVMLDRIEKAFETLGNPEARRAYNAAIRPDRPEFQQRAYFRKSTERLEIEDVEEEEKSGNRLRSLIGSALRRNKNHRDPKDGRTWQALQQSRYYYGEYLKRVREKRGLTLDELARSCEIEPTHLRALEAEDYDALPDGEALYNLLRRYARCLGLGSGNGRDSPRSEKLGGNLKIS
jgi:DnaJ-class molecular chaperone